MTHRGLIRFAAVLAALLALLFAWPAQGQDSANAGKAVDSASGYYIRGGVSLRIIELPHYSPFWDRGNVLHAAKTRTASLLNPTICTPGLELSVGKRLGQGWFAELGGDYFAYDELRSLTVGPSSPWPHVSYFPVDGRGTSRGTAFDSDVELDFATSRETIQLLVGREFETGSTTITPMAGVWGGYSNSRYEVHYYNSASADEFQLNEEVWTATYGLLAGLRLAQPMGSALLSLEALAGAGMARSYYKGDYTHSVDGYFDTHQIKHTLTSRAALTATFGVPLWPDWMLEFKAGGHYLSYAPQIVSSGRSNVEPEGEAAHIARTEELGATLGLTIKYAF